MSGEPELLSDGRVKCHNCGNKYERIGYHWSNGSCDYPSLPRDAEYIITGLMLGDGTLRTQTDNPFIHIYTTNKEFLEYLDDSLGWITTGVSEYRSAEKSASMSDGDVSDYNDVYVLQTRTMPQFNRYESWYGDGTKTLPSYLILTPDTARIWYACSGCLNWDRRYPQSRPYVTISIRNIVDNTDHISKMFDESSFEYTPKISEDSVRFDVGASKEFLEWIGDPLPGFEYKWAYESFDEYDDLT